VPVYINDTLKRAIALFPKSSKPAILNGPFKVKEYARVPDGRSWSQLSKNEKSAMRDHDFEMVGEELSKKGIAFQRNGGKVTIEGVDYTIHHHHKLGQFELVNSAVHKSVGHIGMAAWHRYLTRGVN
jgi:hypothetical protein